MAVAFFFHPFEKFEFFSHNELQKTKSILCTFLVSFSFSHARPAPDLHSWRANKQRSGSCESWTGAARQFPQTFDHRPSGPAPKLTGGGSQRPPQEKNTPNPSSLPHPGPRSCQGLKPESGGGGRNSCSRSAWHLPPV